MLLAGFRPGGRLTFFFQKESKQRKLSPLLTTLRLRYGQPDSGISTGARQNSTSSPRALRSDNCLESDVEVLIGTCRSKPPVESPESGVIRRADSGAGSNTALCFARARFHPHPCPLPPAGEGARKSGRGSKRQALQAHVERSRETKARAQQSAENTSSKTDFRRLPERSDAGAK